MRGGQAFAAGTLAVVVLGVAAVLGLSRTADVERVDATICPEGSRAGEFDEGGRRGACSVLNTEQRDVTFGVVVRNPGRIPLTVTDVPLDTLFRVGFTPHEVVEGEPPFRLEQGDEQRVLVRGELPDCELRTTGGATTYTDLALRIRALGVSRNTSVALDPAVRLVSEPC